MFYVIESSQATDNPLHVKVKVGMAAAMQDVLAYTVSVDLVYTRSLASLNDIHVAFWDSPRIICWTETMAGT